MDTPKVNHLLHKHGVLKTFHISRAIDKREVSDVYKKLNIDEKSATDETREKITKMLYVLTQENFSGEHIPGALHDVGSRPLTPVLSTTQKERKLFELMDTAHIVSDILLSSELTPKECSFVIGTVIKNLNLNSPQSLTDDELEAE
ncbi:MAG: hypothetical protein ACXACA_02880 [Candidatus Ranarchaeia archaeon]|jgi:hypothetical protein